jgi:hypothetical protein
LSTTALSCATCWTRPPLVPRASPPRPPRYRAPRTARAAVRARKPCLLRRRCRPRRDDASGCPPRLGWAGDRRHDARQRRARPRQRAGPPLILIHRSRQGSSCEMAAAFACQARMSAADTTPAHDALVTLPVSGKPPTSGRSTSGKAAATLPSLPLWPFWPGALLSPFWPFKGIVDWGVHEMNGAGRPAVTW